jgi:hypothetical protein
MFDNLNQHFIVLIFTFWAHWILSESIRRVRAGYPGETGRRLFKQAISAEDSLLGTAHVARDPEELNMVVCEQLN